MSVLNKVGIVLLIVLPTPITTRLFTVLLILATAAAVVLYQPSTVAGIGG